jgi:hypothetical protein
MTISLLNYLTVATTLFLLGNFVFDSGKGNRATTQSKQFARQILLDSKIFSLDYELSA